MEAQLNKNEGSGGKWPPRAWFIYGLFAGITIALFGVVIFCAALVTPRAIGAMLWIIGPTAFIIGAVITGICICFLKNDAEDGEKDVAILSVV